MSDLPRKNGEKNMKWQCTVCDKEAERYNHPDFDHCKRNGHKIWSFVEEHDLPENSPTNQIQSREEQIELGSLAQIENPKHSGKLVKVKAVVGSNSVSYCAPRQIKVKCHNSSDEHSCKKEIIIDLPDETIVQFADVSNSTRRKLRKEIAAYQFTDECNLNVTETKCITLSKVRIRPIVASLEKNDGKFFDSEGNEWKAYDVYILQNEVINIDAGKEIELVGRIIADPKSQRVTLVISKLREADSDGYDLNKIKMLRTVLASKNLDEKVDWIIKEFGKFSKIIGRENIACSGFLTFFSPTSIKFEGKEVPGWVKTTVVGDSTTGKSETIRQMIILLRAGQIISGETASVAGLGAAVSQSSNNQWFVDFGALVLQDRKLLAVDGAHKLSRENWAILAEAEREGRIKIQKAAKGEAYARTRQIRIMNPLGDDGQTTKTMNSFFHPVMSIQNNLQIQSIARFDLAVFVSDDVSPGQRNIMNGQVHDAKLECLADLLKFVWREKYKVRFQDGVTNEILSQATYLENKFKHEDIPLITNDQKYKLAKLAVSLAALTCSLDDNLEYLTVTKEHVAYVTEFIEREYHNAGLDELAKNTHQTKIDDGTISKTISSLKTALQKKNNVSEQTCMDILVWVAEKRKFTKDDIKTKFELSRDYELIPLVSTLKNEDIINNSRSGFTPTKKGIEMGKYLVQNPKTPKAPSGSANTKNPNDTETGILSFFSDFSTREVSSPCNQLSTGDVK